jgi:Domain of unknown function(DUF2779)
LAAVLPSNPALRLSFSLKLSPLMLIQWSDHILKADGGVIHREFLHADRTDPRRSFAEKLIETVSGKGSIVVYGSFDLNFSS